MTPEVAFEVEAALIDATPGLSNEVSGQNSGYGPANATQLQERYAAEEMEISSDHKVVIVKLQQTTVEKYDSMYEAVRTGWKVKKARADKAEFVIGAVDGICRGVYKPEGEWKKCAEKPKRFEFIGQEAEDTVKKMYLGKRLPDYMRKKGNLNPVQYENI